MPVTGCHGRMPRWHRPLQGGGTHGGGAEGAARTHQDGGIQTPGRAEMAEAYTAECTEHGRHPDCAGRTGGRRDADKDVSIARSAHGGVAGQLLFGRTKYDAWPPVVFANAWRHFV